MHRPCNRFVAAFCPLCNAVIILTDGKATFMPVIGSRGDIYIILPANFHGVLWVNGRVDMKIYEGIVSVQVVQFYGK